MCGIAGIAGLRDGEVLNSKIRKMTDRLAHRGPDAEGFFVGDGAALGHRRLSIIDLSVAANQPLYDETGRYAIVLNGEIYNYKQVKASITDYPYRTDSDSEAILAAFIKYGPECLNFLNGMFAFAIWDDKEKRLFVARDRLGVKPLYYSLTTGGTFLFASEIRSILESELVERKLDRSGLFEFLLYQSVYAPRTIVENISQLPAGTYGTFDENGLSIKSYWQVEKPERRDEITDRSDAVRKTRELFANAIESRMVSDVPVGAFLSGGIDSSAVVAMMSEVSGGRINTFSVTFDEPEFDESQHSELIARKFNTEHSSIRLKADDFLRQLPDALKAMDSPSGDGLNTYVVSKATKDTGLKVALSGLGGDELFAGYHYFRQWRDLKSGLLSRIPLAGRKLAARALALAASSKYKRISDILRSENLGIADVYPRTRQVMSDEVAADYGKNGDSAVTIERTLIDRRRDIEKFPLLSQFTIAELLGYTQNVLLKDTDQFSMASALEVREPFFDYRLVQYVLNIPDEMKLTGTPKALLVEALGDLLPKSVTDRSKMGFVLPFEKWMREELREFCERRVNNLAERGLFSSDTLLEKWRTFQQGGSVRWSELWHLIVLTDWLETNRF